MSHLQAATQNRRASTIMLALTSLGLLAINTVLQVRTMIAIKQPSVVDDNTNRAFYVLLAAAIIGLLGIIFITALLYFSSMNMGLNTICALFLLINGGLSTHASIKLQCNASNLEKALSYTHWTALLGLFGGFFVLLVTGYLATDKSSRQKVIEGLTGYQPVSKQT